MSEEVWKCYPEYPDRYEVSNTGRVRSVSFLKHTRNVHGPMSFMTKPKELVQFENEQGYM